MRKRIIAFLMTLTLMLSMTPVTVMASGYLPDLNDKALYYTPDYRSGDCILSSSKSMLRRAAVRRGSYKWDSITNTALRGIATTSGGAFRNSFTYKNDGISYTVINQELSGSDDDKTSDVIKLLANHPEGIIIWGRGAATSGTHGILVTGVRNGVLYAVDSTHNTYGSNVGIETWEKTTMKSIKYCSDVWFISKVNGGASTTAAASGASTLCVTGVRQPETIGYGNKFSIAGLVQSNYKIRTVTVSVIDSAGREVISASAAPSDVVFALRDLDKDVRFGTLASGTYTYRIKASDEKKGTTVLHENTFEVGAAPESAAASQSLSDKLKISISSIRMPKTLKKGRKFTIKGKIRSSRTMTAVKVAIVDKSGKTVLSAKAKPYSTYYDILKIDKKITFAKLKKGKYKIKVRARTSMGWKTVLTRSFKVK